MNMFHSNKILTELLLLALISPCIYSLSFSRLQASEAAKMILRAYEEKQVMTLITSDASRGSVSPNQMSPFYVISSSGIYWLMNM